MVISNEISAEEMGRELCEAGMTIACAESCTGGLLTSTLTDVPGSSAYVVGSVISYANHVKSRILHGPEHVLTVCGAVSEETARVMAESIRQLMQTDIGVGITGIAGPDGGSADKPVGLVYIAVADRGHTTVKKNIFSGTRMQNKQAAVGQALDMIRDVIRGST